MKKKFLTKLDKKKHLPLSIYYLNEFTNLSNKTFLKLAKCKQLNSEGYALHNFYKPISKF
jgi:hypothetical protein